MDIIEKQKWKKLIEIGKTQSTHLLNSMKISKNMEGTERWYFTKEQLCATPSRKCGIDADKELSYRQQAATLIQDMGQRLQVTQLCINTAIVYMHRFYMFHSFTKFHRNMISSCALFLAAKVEEQPRKLEHVIKMSHACLFRENHPLDVKSEAIDLVANENFMLQTLGFELAVQHPHTSVVNCCQLVRASKDLAQTSYFMATNSLHLTTMCLQYKPTVVACVCIHLACKWSNWEIPRSSEGKDWFFYVDEKVTVELLEMLTSEFIAILDKCPSRLKRKILAGSSGSSNGPNSCNPIPKSITENDKNDKKNSSAKTDAKMLPSSSKPALNQTTTDMNATQQRSPSSLVKKVKQEVPQQSNKIPSTMSFSAYQEKKRAQMQKQEQTKQLEQTKPNLSKQSVNPISRELNLADDTKPINYDKQLVKQNQINMDKQRQIDERNKNLIKPNLDHLFDSNTRSLNLSKSSTSYSAQQKHSQNNLVSEDFLDNLVNKPLNNMHFNSIFNVEGDDSSDFKKEIATDLKMEFSDNDSNQSSVGLNLTAIPSAFMNDSSDSKTGMNTQLNSITDGAKTTSFMSIFSTPSTLNSTPLCQPKLEKMDKAENAKNNNIPANVKYDALLRIKPEIPTAPPMLSPLKQDCFSGTPNNHETQLFYHNSKNENSLPVNKLDAVLDIKPTVSTMQSNNSKVSPIVQKSKSPQKNRMSNQHKNLNIGHMNTHQLAIKKEKEVLDLPPMPQITVKKERDFTDLPQMPQITIKKDRDVADVTQNTKIPEVLNNSQLNNSSYNFGTNNGSKAGMSSISATPLIPKSEFKEIMSKPLDIPSVNASKQLSSNSTSIDFGIKQYTELPQKSALYSCPSPQTNISNVVNVNNISSVDVCDTKTTHNNIKEVKDKHSHEHHDRHHHHKSRHHSHKSSKHKEKHKHKHKDKDREKDKHKRKDKDRDREKRHKTKDNDSAFKIDKSSPIDDFEQSSAPRESIKLKISKKKLSVDEPEKSDMNIQNPLKLRIQLKDTKMAGNASVSPVGSNNGNASRKRKSSPKASKKEKIAKYDNETHIMCDNTANEEPLKSKKANSSQKNLMNDKNALKSDTKPLVNAGLAHQTMRSSKASHK